jgi:hypothetical protein
VGERAAPRGHARPSITSLFTTALYTFSPIHITDKWVRGKIEEILGVI